MGNLTRKQQKVFAQNAVNNGQFGSLQLGTKILTTDTDVIQALAAFLEGWNDAVISGEKIPAVEEFQALHFLTTRQLSYLLDKGIPEWEIGTEYFIGDIQREVGGTKLYKSITDENAGNVLTDVGNWALLGDLVNLINTAQATETTLGTAEIATQAETDTGTDDTRFITPLKYAAGFSNSKTTNGYTFLPNGLIFQWGTAFSVAPNTNVTVTLPVVFSSAILNGNSNYNSVGDLNEGSRIFLLSNSQIQVRNDTFSGPHDVMWSVIGH